MALGELTEEAAAIVREIDILFGLAATVTHTTPMPTAAILIDPLQADLELPPFKKK